MIHSKKLAKLIFVFSILIPSISFATGPFAPGAVLDPGCFPTDPNCTISTSTSVTYVYASSTFPSFTYASSTYLTVASGTALYVPYTGGTSNVNIGAHNFLVDGTALFVDATTHSVSLNNSTASGLNSFSTNYAEASGEAASAFGDGTLASGVSSFAIGESSTASGVVSFAAGRSATASHFNSMVFSDANGANSTAANQATLSFGNGIILNPNGGNVGIGTSNPSTKLTILGNSDSVDSTVQIVGNGISTLFLGQDFDGGILRGQGGNNSLKFLVGGGAGTQASDGTEAMRILSNGNIGIGTTTPNSKLTVMGSVYTGIGDSSQISQINTTSVGSTPVSVAVSGRYAYVVNDNGTNNFSVIDISNPLSPTQIVNSSFGGYFSSIAISGRYAYVTEAGNGALFVFDISNPSSPVQVATTSVGSDPRSVAVSGRYAYVANEGSDNVSVIDISNPSSPVQISTVSVGTSPHFIAISGRYAYTANIDDNNISVIDISNPLSPIQITTASVGSDPYAVAVSGRYAYVANRIPDTISVVDISNPSSPIEITTVVVGADPKSITISGRYAYVGNYNDNTISVIDISNPTSPIQIATTATGVNPSSISVSGHYAYIANRGDGTMSVVDLAGTDIGNLLAGAIEAGNINVQNDITAAGFVNVGTALSVGIGGIKSDGGLSVAGKFYSGISSSSISRIATVSSIGDYPQSITISGHYAYTANQNDTVSVIDISNPASPVQIAIATTAVSSGPASISVSGRYAYTSNANDNTISVIDISNPYSPIQVATTSVGAYPNSLALSGHYAYTADYNDSTISVVDISNPLVPIKVATTSVGNSPYSIFISGRYAYTVNANTNDISVVDISNPLAPAQVGSTSVGNTPYSVAVSGRYAYVANNGDNTMSVVDISNPASPVQITTIPAGTQPYNISISGRYAYVTDYGSSKLTIIDISNPLFPVKITSTTVGNTPYSVAVSGRYAYTANNGSGDVTVVDLGGVDVGNLLAGAVEAGNINVQNDITAAGFVNVGTALSVGIGGIKSDGGLSVTGKIYNGISTSSQISQVATTPVGNAPYSITISGSYLYTTNISANTISVVDISNPSAPIQIATTTVGTNPASIVVRGKYAYIANGSSNNISVVDISNPSAPIEVATALAGSSPQGIAISGHYVYTSNVSSNNISVVDISNPLSPVEVATTPVGSNPYFITISGRYAYVSNYGSDTISVVDISNPLSPIQVATASVGTGPQGIVVSGSYAYVANLGGANISVVDISNPLSPVQVTTTSVGTNPYSLTVSGRYAYVANYVSNTVSVVDISNPSSPVLVATTPVGTQPYSIVVSGKYAYLTNMGDNAISVIDLAGVDVGNLLAGAIEAGNINVQNDINAAGFVNVGTALSVGIGGIMSNGGLSITGTSTFQDILPAGTYTGNMSPYSLGASTTRWASVWAGIVNIGTSTFSISQTGDRFGIFNQANGGGNETFSILSNGNIGIGTTTPGSALSIVGGIDLSGNINSLNSGFNSIGTLVYSSNIVPTMTTDTSPSGVVTYSSQFGGGLLGFHAFDHVPTSGWTNAEFDLPAYVGYQFTSGKVVTSYSITGYFIEAARMIKDWTFEGSNNGSSWTVLDTETNQSAWGLHEVRTYPFSNSTSYAYYRVNISANNGSSYTELEEIEMYTSSLTDFKVGIGTTTPQARLDVYGVAGNNAIANFASSSNTSVLYIAASGKVGIGTTTPTANLTIEGTPTSTLLRLANIGAGSLTSDADGNIINTSDERLKDITGSYIKGLTEIEQLTPINYKWKTETGLDASTTYSGFSAQNVQAVIPEAVGQNKAGFLTLNDRPIIAALVNAVKEIGSFIRKIENGIAYLKDIVVERLTVGSKEKPAGVTMYSKNGNAFCMTVSDTGSFESNTGECNNSTTTPIITTATVFTPETIISTTTSTSTDTQTPTINILGLNPEELIVNQTYTDAGATAIDDTDTVVSVSATGTVDTTVEGIYSVIYSATDAAGNTGTSIRTVNVIPEPATSTPIIIDMATTTP